jgi:hypothetical protein
MARAEAGSDSRASIHTEDDSGDWLELIECSADSQLQR